MDSFIDLIFTALCISVPIGVIVAIAILGTKARQRFANELQKKLDEGFYSDWAKPPMANRLRTIAAIQIVNLLVILFTLIMWLSKPSETVQIILASIFGVVLLISVLLGIIMTRLLKGK